MAFHRPRERIVHQPLKAFQLEKVNAGIEPDHKGSEPLPNHLDYIS